ncbi:uncharacterized protein BXZ73DRAFT_108321 [Epithele typhae]|uniref:uncharacterized protein n=1 Tax=Epithele typhae TaxID=378194 RepID=UPI0020089734|nr:uncharacterized protein BXZ73DRAFT_108321 [Epithele typhae]KAH9911000.1 hypothetical protein BXZ73DRAFT_108321 [Epithele typhae]
MSPSNKKGKKKAKAPIPAMTSPTPAYPQLPPDTLGFVNGEPVFRNPEDFLDDLEDPEVEAEWLDYYEDEAREAESLFARPGHRTQPSCSRAGPSSRPQAPATPPPFPPDAVQPDGLHPYNNPFQMPPNGDPRWLVWDAEWLRIRNALQASIGDHARLPERGQMAVASDPPLVAPSAASTPLPSVAVPPPGPATPPPPPASGVKQIRLEPILTEVLGLLLRDRLEVTTNLASTRIVQTFLAHGHSAFEAQKLISDHPLLIVALPLLIRLTREHAAAAIQHHAPAARPLDPAAPAFQPPRPPRPPTPTRHQPPTRLRPPRPRPRSLPPPSSRPDGGHTTRLPHPTRPPPLPAPSAPRSIWR